MTTLADFSAVTLAGQEVDLVQYLGQVVLVVNTASKCGLTPQYAGLQELFTEYGPAGLVVLGFPCDQFAHQEPGDSAAIEEFCSINYGVTFPMFAKVNVNGKDAHPLFKWLRQETRSALGSAVKWNFTKFLLGRDGLPLARFAPTTEPAKLRADIERALATPAS